jgi:DNA-binding MarR family transcriptional regulator
MEQDFEKRLQAIGITRGAYAVLSAIHHDRKTTPAVLANFLGVDGAAITRLLDRIEKDGLIRRQPSATDRRSIDIGITQEGIRVARRGRADSKATNRKFTACLSATEIDHFHSAMQKILTNAKLTVADL